KSFVREARLASYLRHENVAQTYDLGRVDDTYFIVMELITGRNLREVLRHCGVTTGPMPVQFALNILNQVCDALDYAHNLCDDTVMTALERDPERRWQHATALRSALTTLTRRLGLVASNAQVVQWLDWAFSQPPRQAARSANEPDTDDKTADQPSLAMGQTVEHRTIKQHA